MFLIDRGKVKDWLLTGYASLTLHASCSLGQRQLLVGDNGTGKTTLLSNIGLNNTLGSYFFCPNYFKFFFYNFIGSSRREFVYLKFFHKSLNKKFNYFIDSTISNDLYSQILTPYNIVSYCLLLALNGVSSVHVLDSLTNHAKLYRAFMLSLKRSPGREAYPGDIFYLHSSLLERYGCLSYFFNRGSITSLPVATIQNGDITDYITTNLISITDGQWFLSKSLSIRSLFPSFDVNLSVSRLGSISQDSLLRFISSKFKDVIFPFLLSEDSEGSINSGSSFNISLIKGKFFYDFYFYKKGLSYISLILSLILFLLFDGFSFCNYSSNYIFSNLYFLRFGLNRLCVPIFWLLGSVCNFNNIFVLNYAYYLFNSKFLCF